MTSRKTCDKCGHYTPEVLYRAAARNYGECAFMGDVNDHNGGGQAADRCSGWDRESYSAGVYVGPKFGCIHWEKKK